MSHNFSLSQHASFSNTVFLGKHSSSLPSTAKMNSSDACNTYCSESLFSSNFSSNIQCGPVASFLAPYYSSGTINPGDLAKFYQTLRPDYGQNVSGILSLSWFACAITCNGNKTDEYFSSLKNICREDLCRTMQWDGDPDIAGKGVCDRPARREH